MSFNFVVNFWVKVDENGSMTWTVNPDKIFILYFFNGENIDLENILFSLNTLDECMDSTLKTGNFLSPCKSQILNIGTMITLKEWNLSVEKDFFYLFNYLLIKNAKVQELFIYCGNVLAFCCFFKIHKKNLFENIQDTTELCLIWMKPF